MTFEIYKDKILSELTGSPHFSDFKVMLCGIGLKEFDKSNATFEYEVYEKIINKHIKKLPQIEEYKTHLWKFGHCLYIDKKDFEERPRYQFSIDLLEKFNFLLDNKDAKISITNKGFIAESIFFDNPRYTEILIDELKKEIEESKINRFGYVNIDGKQEIVNDKEKFEDEEIFIEPFSLDQRELVEKKIEQLKYWKIKDGEDVRKKPVYRAVHMGMHALLNLLRIDEFFIRRETFNSIDNIKISNQMCEFVADFLVFFQVYNDQNLIKSSKLYSNIRNLYRYPQKCNSSVIQ
ncbi:MAG: hypothetical protein E6772_13700 [Dysgonomonas sp.]|nr:hypothetical protein [Dysgonomonas sp.]